VRVGRAAVAALLALRLGGIALADETLERLVDRLGDEDERETAGAALAALGEPGRARLRAAANDPRRDVRLGALEALGETRDPESVPAVAARVGDDDVEVAVAALGALGRIGHADAERAIVPRLRASEPRVRAAAAQACRLSCPTAAGREALLRAALDDPDVPVGIFARKSLETRLREPEFRKAAADHAAKRLADPDRRARLRAALVLADTGDRRAYDALVEGLRDEDALLRSHAAYALGSLGDRRAVAALAPLVGDEGVVRLSVFRSLVLFARAGDPEAQRLVRQHGIRDAGGDGRP
jgi:HEAT repeat protein